MEWSKRCKNCFGSSFVLQGTRMLSWLLSKVALTTLKSIGKEMFVYVR